MLSYPLFFALRDCFMGSSGGSNLQPMSRLSSLLNQNNGLYHKYFRDVSLLATFVDKCVANANTARRRVPVVLHAGCAHVL